MMTIEHALEDSIALGKAAERMGMAESDARRAVAALATLPAEQATRILDRARADGARRSNRSVRRGQ